MGKFQGQKNLDRKEVFWSKVDIKSEGECWNYKGGKSSNGYGIFWLNGKQVGAHRVAFEYSYSDKIKRIPDDLSVLHICDNPFCCNPMHLYLGTQKNNMQDRSKRNGNIRGKLYAGEIWLIRKLRVRLLRSKKTYKFSQRFVAKMFKVDHATIASIWQSDKYPCREGYYV